MQNVQNFKEHMIIKKRWFFLLVCLGFKGVVILWEQPPKIAFNFIFQKWWKEKDYFLLLLCLEFKHGNWGAFSGTFVFWYFHQAH
jgi:hypothetical protein